MSKIKRIITNCNGCGRDTFQTILFSKRKIEIHKFNDGETIKDYTDYMVVQCNGCDLVSFLQRNIGEIYEDGENNYLDLNFPDRKYYEIEKMFLNDDERAELPTSLHNLYLETQAAFREEANILAGIGLRVLVEALCLHQKIQGRNLQEKIKNLHTSGLISKSEEPILDKLRLIGNSSAHEIRSLPIDKLEYALQIINHVLKSIYILPKINKKLKI